MTARPLIDPGTSGAKRAAVRSAQDFDLCDLRLVVVEVEETVQIAVLSRDSLVDQRILFPLEVQGLDGGVDGLVEEVCVCEGLMGKKVGLEVSPDGFDIVEFGRVFGQPLDAQPMGARGQRGLGRLAGMDRAVVEDDYDGPLALTGLGAVEMVKFF